ncbi:CoB--CoM heterodisulfide reductase subunit C [Candidatus Bathyarchaeota archaeon]|nr:CoB--CoM heterodisulfide reductase subunit C [Candidatus Bathyarchaeota archaeon]
MVLIKEQIKKIDKSIVEEVVEDELLERFKSCYQCGTCTGGCPSGRRAAIRTRDVIRQALVGLDDDLLSSDLLWLCSTCYTCYERCPRDVPTTDIIIKLRNIASHRGLMKGPHLAVSKMLIETGHGVPINDEKWSNLRKSLKLTPLPPTVHSFPEAVKEVQTIIKELKFDELIAYGEEVKKKLAEEEKKRAPERIEELEAELKQLKEEAGK